MVPVAGKPCMEHILELVRRHGITNAVATLAYMPQVIRGYFGEGSHLGVELDYSVEEVPAGTAGSVKLLEHYLDETFLVVSGDALTDMDLTSLIEFHRYRGAVATIALKRVPDPLEFGVVITGEDGRIERFLEKPTWGEVFSDTINTGIYVLEPEVLRADPGRRALRLLEGAVPAPAGGRRAALRVRRRGLLAGHREPDPVPGGQPRRARRQGRARDARACGCARTSGWGRGRWSSRSSASRARP